MSGVLRYYDELLGLGPVLQQRLLQTAAVILLLIALRILGLYLIRRGTSDVRTRYRWRKTATYVLALAGMLLVGRIWFEGFGDIATFLGIVSAGLVIALKDVVVDLAGWVFILGRRPFVVGDRVQVGPHAGDVIDVSIFQFTLLEIGNWVDADQSTGRIVHVPNGMVFTEPVANFTGGLQYIWNEIPVRITFESDWRRAKSLLLEIAARHGDDPEDEAARRVAEASRKFMIVYPTLTPTVYTSVGESGVVLTLRYLCDPRRRRGTAQAIWEDVLEAFAGESSIRFAYPARRMYGGPAPEDGTESFVPGDRRTARTPAGRSEE